MNVLLCNDDGINSLGLLALANEMSKFGKLYIYAPDTEKSAASNCITLMQPLRAIKTDFPIKEAEAYAVSGTPADCAKLGLANTAKENIKIDLVVSGINKGPNMCCDITYSGTVAAATEGAFANILSLAVSLNSYDKKSDFTIAAKYAAKCLKILLNSDLPHDKVYNINVPYISEKEIKGIKITRVGTLDYQGGYEKRIDPYGKEYYWTCAKPVIVDKSEDTDIVAVKNNFVSITPLTPDQTDYPTLKKLYELF